MAGVTDLAFRTMCKRFGADVIYTEFASANALVHGNEATRKMIAFRETERPVVCQIFGNDPAMFAGAARVLESLGFDGIDINFGCPAYKVVAHGGGVMLMRDLDLCYALVKATCEATSLPVSVKIRSSIGCERKGTDACKQKVTAVDLVERMQDLPVAALMIHGRTYEKPFDGAPDVGMIKEVRDRFAGVLIANGGVYTPEAAREMRDATGADGIGIGRGSHGKPWIFRQIKEYLATGAYQKPSWQKKKQIILDHAHLAFAEGGAHGLLEMRKHLAWYVKGIYNASEMRNMLVQTKSLEDVEAALAQI
jgi:tRNA-dihydrouridine synthase B